MHLKLRASLRLCGLVARNKSSNRHQGTKTQRFTKILQNKFIPTLNLFQLPTIINYQNYSTQLNSHQY